MLGLSFSAFTTLHVVISLIGIATGLVVLWGMLNGRDVGGLTALFLASTVLTSVTGFMFPFNQLLPSHFVGGISLVVLAIALFALYGKGLSGGWRLDLHRDRHRGALSQRVRRRRAGVPEVRLSSGAGAHAVGDAVRRRAARRAGAVRDPGIPGA